jgi:hypothetical protein
MQQMHEEIIATIPQPPHEDTVVEVAIIYDTADHARVELRELTWADGIGWYRQKTLSLEAAAADALLKSLGQVRRHLHTHTHTPDQAREDCKVIPFPGARPSSERPRQTLALECGAEVMKKKCCERFKRKGRACKTCPTMAKLAKKDAKKLLKVSQKH